MSKSDCFKALDTAVKNKVGLSDAIAFIAMIKSEVKEIYSFDRDFYQFEDISMLSE